MLENIKRLFSPKELLKGNFGIEREGLRCDESGNLSMKNHPKVFGDKLSNPYITTDFSESQMELITPTFKSTEETYKFLSALYDIVAMEIEDEYLWPQSMPCIIPEDNKIPIARFSDNKLGKTASEYREKLLQKYGGKKQLLSGIHYNFSFNEKFIKKLYENSDKALDYKHFKNKIYLKVSRNYLRYRWLLIYLLGGTGTVHETYIEDCVRQLEEVGEGGFSNEGALSYRNSECGYTNEHELFPSYNSVEEYVESLNRFIKEGLIESPRELYSQIRLKAKGNYSLMDSLIEDGISYLEYRSIDINPFDKAGISLEDLEFINIFNLFLLIENESNYERWQEDALENQNIIARYGQNKVTLKKDGNPIDKEEWGIEILEKIKKINEELNLEKEDILNKMIEKIKDYKLTYAYKIIEKVKEEGYVEAHLNLAKSYKEDAYINRFKLEGYEDLELSTQILMKESIKRGMTVDLVDRNDNFISLTQGDKVEYVKQATKTSKDNYVTVLMMENKVVTKDILRKHNIKVPKGEEYNSLEEAISEAKDYINKPIVIKPKSTNFGIGISIFPEGASEDDIVKGLEIAFKYDNTVLLEEFITGKEYRFMVINDKVVGILHRVPANVTGDSIHSIRELVDIKNQSPLRGKGYKTPLEKINLDENAELFLKQRNLDFDFVPSKGEIVYLRENSNISTGGDSIDYTDDIPDRFKQIAIASAKSVGANICGVDMMIDDYRDENSQYAIIEVNFNPAIHIHCYPYQGVERNIAKEILELLEF
ncbi:bifunctional glutamate--cysteine ligase GshA/glutathione synthetase GshB [Enterococcus faecium]|uniref:bifunctional glutamate--cysteine ligase GshA/glutathione synthetase GshB n=1 Tax=Enterococcus faecium TaxID=1352 RepID=UPI000CF08512|nr:bifunctional glutamate--cysteine ligase GshA/glutathione synthetase GshB [Enterococcus faecium]CAI3510470.1 bifunctional glutamate--cysteine ligase GshA/glutathione synthetase GshB [Enterococcus cecorum]EGP5096004.1 bifunctional glutamate--cysteine ligase GshA/glutathione synthetase GshB [Enterococcus faecium]PQB67115.1 bifunctional glutamate--cysteine ligase GshA/glutathione synthetase GshB [Enterococcus faecium]PQB96681.1 bifunctional glutamate--cysteine ligase GshA/glutathione synthetase 